MHIKPESLTIEQLITAFNDNNQLNTKIIDYLSRKNIFDILGKSRDELAHSRFLKELLAGSYYYSGKESTILHLLDILIKRDDLQKRGVFKTDPYLSLKKAVLSRDLSFLSITMAKTEYSLGSYLKDNEIDDKKIDKTLNEGNRFLSLVKNCHPDWDKGKKISEARKSLNKNRIDLYLKLQLESSLEKKQGGHKEIEIFIENKVNSKEHDEQTQTYFDFCSIAKNKKIQLFVYLSPVSNRSLYDYTSLDLVEKPSCNNFIHINYQDILNSIIEPLLSGEAISQHEKSLLEEYVNCLELPAYEGDNEEYQDKSIMATSSNERQLIKTFQQNKVNKQMSFITTVHKVSCLIKNTKTNVPLPFVLALREIVESNANNIFSCLSQFKNVISSSGGGTPLLIYCPTGNVSDGYLNLDCWVCNGTLFSDDYLAAKESIMCYIASNPGSNVVDVLNAGKGANQKFLSKTYQDGYEKVGDYYLSRSSINMQSITEKLKNITPLNDESSLSHKDTWFQNLKQLSNPEKYMKLVGNYYWREIDNDRISAFVEASEEAYSELSLYEKTLLDSFYVNHKILILSTYKILSDQANSRESIDNDIFYKSLMKIE